jgi:prevent-host-death family protein
MSFLTVQEAQAKLSELIHSLKPGDEVVITENDQPVARLVLVSASTPSGVLARFGAR